MVSDKVEERMVEKILDDAGHELVNLDFAMEQLQKKRDECKKDIFSLFDKLFGEGEKAEFALNDGTVISRIVRVSEVLDEEKLKSLVPNEWLDITVERRMVDSDRLQKAISSGVITIEQVKPAISQRKSYALTSRKRKEKNDAVEVDKFMSVLKKALRKEE